MDHKSKKSEKQTHQHQNHEKNDGHAANYNHSPTTIIKQPRKSLFSKSLTDLRLKFSSFSSSQKTMLNNNKSNSQSSKTINLVEKALEHCPLATSEELIRLQSIEKSCRYVTRLTSHSRSSLMMKKHQLMDNLCEREASAYGILKSLSHTKKFSSQDFKIKTERNQSKTKTTEIRQISSSSRNDSNSLMKGGCKHEYSLTYKIGSRSCDRRRHNIHKMDNVRESLRPGPGILERAQHAEQTLTGLKVMRETIDRILTQAQQLVIQMNPRIPDKYKNLLVEPYNQMSTILDHLGLTGVGGLIQERLEQLRQQPVRCLINVTYETPLIKLPNVPDWETFRIPVADDKQEDIGKFFDEVSDKIEQVRQRNYSTVVHCMAGVSRSATIVMAYLIRYSRMTTKEAFEHTKRARPCINPNISFLEQLVQYEWKCFENYQNNQRHHNSNNININRTKMITYSMNGITKSLPDFIIDRHLNEYRHEFE